MRWHVLVVHRRLLHALARGLLALGFRFLLGMGEAATGRRREIVSEWFPPRERALPPDLHSGAAVGHRCAAVWPG